MLLMAVLFVAASAAAQTPAIFQVTTAGDSGPGSLREAIFKATGEGQCDGRMACEIRFQNVLFSKIALQSPLPVITACRLVIGEPRDPLLPKLPLIELNGSALTSGNGFEIRSSCPSANDIVIRGFAITGFPGSGIAMLPPTETKHGTVGPELRVQGNHVGCDRNGTFAVPNGRGVFVADENGFVVVEQNLISGNLHSGVFVSASRFAAIRDNAIGTMADKFTPLPNGASGIYVERTAARITTNTIAYNRDFGIAVSPLVARLTATENALFDNGWLGIDFGLDGRVNSDIPEASPIPIAPTLTDVNGPVVRGIAHIRASDSQPFANFRILLYATPAWRRHGEAESNAFSTVLDVPRDGAAHDVPFEIRVPSSFSLFDTIVTAQMSISIATEEPDVNTSELSSGVRYHCCS